MQIKIKHFKVKLAGLDFGKIKNIVNDGKQSVGAGQHGFKVFALQLRKLRVQQQARHADHCIHGRAYLMTHIGKEFTFCLVCIIRPARQHSCINQCPFQLPVGSLQCFFSANKLGLNPLTLGAVAYSSD